MESEKVYMTFDLESIREHCHAGAITPRDVQKLILAVDSYQAEIRRLQAELASVRANLTQISESRDAERAARQNAERERDELRDHIERLFGTDDRPSIAVRALLLRARGKA